MNAPAGTGRASQPPGVARPALPGTAPPPPGRLRCDHCLLEFPEREAVREPARSPAGQDGGRSGAGGTPLADGGGTSSEGRARVFCCTGCLGVYRLLSEEGLTRFYDGRRWDEPGLFADPERPVDAAPFRGAVVERDGLAQVDLYVDGIRCASCVWLNERLLSRLPGVRSARVNYATHRARVRWDPAEASLEKVLGRVRAAGYEPRPWSESERQRTQDAEVRDLLVRLGTAFFLSSQLMIYSAALYAGYFQGMQPGTRRLMEVVALALTLPVVLYSGAPFLRSAGRGLRRLRFDMDALIVLGAWAALLYSAHAMVVGAEVYFDTAAMIVTLVLAGRYVEARARARASEAVAHLGRLLPAQARLVVEASPPLVPTPSSGPRPLATQAQGLAANPAPSGTRLVPLDQVRPGDRVEVVPGERVPLDGEVTEGESEVDEALVTGEARPVPKRPGSSVAGGTVNLAGAFTFRVMRVGGDTVLAGIARAVEDAQAHKPRVQRLADRVTAVFVPVVLLLAAGTVAWHLGQDAPVHRALMTGVAVLVIACPCSLGLATPIAVLLATGTASARGLLVKSVDVLEAAARATHAVLDKTGTLTRGRPALRAVHVLATAPAGADTAGRALLLAAAAERRSEHGLGRALREAAASSPLPPPPAHNFRVTPGRGVSAEVEDCVGGASPAAGVMARTLQVLVGNRAHLAAQGVTVDEAAAGQAAALEQAGETVVFLAVGGVPAALLALSDELRPEAAEAVAALRGLGLEPAVVSGDGPGATAAVASRAGVERAVADATPQGKERELARLEVAGARVLMVGDGINDAPALGRAAVSVAMGRGTDVTLDCADAVLVRDDLRLLPGLVRLGRRTQSVIRQNVFWAFFYNVVAIPLAVRGTLHPIVAAACMAASSSFVVLNSLRVRRWS